MNRMYAGWKIDVGVRLQQDVEPALGSELDIVVLDLQSASSNVVGMLQPKDKAKLQALLAKIAQKDPTSKTVTAAGPTG